MILGEDKYVDFIFIVKFRYRVETKVVLSLKVQLQME